MTLLHINRYVLWLRFLDRVRPRYGVGRRPSPRVMTASPEMAARIEEILRRRAKVGPDPGRSLNTAASGPTPEEEHHVA